jgi:hypothetical protein
MLTVPPANCRSNGQKDRGSQRNPGRLSYFFANVSVSPLPAIELQGTYHRGRSIDTRTITLDQLNGHPVESRTLEGLLFESAGGRLWITIARGVRVWGGYTRDRNNRDDFATGRASFGLIIPDLLRSGLDLNLSDSRSKRSGFSDDSWYASLGRNLGRRAYLSADYASSLAVVRVLGQGDIQIESRPQTRRYGISGIIHLNRILSLTLTGEHLRDDAETQVRILGGLTYRFK